jgi:hypothetical protein
MLRTIMTSAAAVCMLALGGCEEGPSGVNPSIELSVIDESGTQRNLRANMMVDGSDVKQVQIPFDAASTALRSVTYSIIDEGDLYKALVAQNLAHLTDASLTITLPQASLAKGTYSLDTASSAELRFDLGGIRYTSVSGSVTITDVSTSDFFGIPSLSGLEGYVSAVCTGRNVRTPSDTKVYTLTISSCRFDNVFSAQ